MFRCSACSLALMDRSDYHQACVNTMLKTYPWNEKYRVLDVNDVLTPALVVYPDVIVANIARTLRLLDQKAERWRAHIKTSKLGFTLRMLLEHDVRNFKCATTLELLTACSLGAEDVLVAYPVMEANARRVCAIAEQFLTVRISVLAETPEQVMQWRDSRVGIFLDINPGMNRTGIEQDNSTRVVQLIREIHSAQLEFRGLHYYDGQYGSMDDNERTSAAHTGYDRLLDLVREIQRNGFDVAEIVTAGTPTFPCSLTYEGFRKSGLVHRVSPGTLVYNDATSLAQLPKEFGYEPAVLVLSRIVSRPADNIVTCDAGHKAVSADAGVPTCVVMGRSELMPLSPSEEHLPLQLNESRGPSLGEALYLLPRHVCPTVNNFDLALAVRGGKIDSVEKVTARGREAPLPDRISGLARLDLIKVSAVKR
jgi:D-serine deaminase-like pyridoxal phosphate-dependent protein